ncbi:MAG: hypothetical protein NTZ33_11300 [Bacteroidetes bacterium]|nr:hypothetical protein [Bacteroidota bacterium]
MNKFKSTDTGGLLLYILDDLRWIDEGIRDAIKGMFTQFGLNPSDNFIFSGCEFTVTSITGGKRYTHTEGYIYLDGEVLKVDAGYIEVLDADWEVGSVIYWDLVITYDIAGNRIFESGVSHDTYEIRKAKLFFDVPGGDVMPYNANDIVSKYLAGFKSKESDWLSAGSLINGWSNIGSPFSNIVYKKDLFDVVHIKGAIYKSSPDTSVIFILPGELCPTETRRFGDIVIESNGDVHTEGGDASQFIEISFKI